MAISTATIGTSSTETTGARTPTTPAWYMITGKATAQHAMFIFKSDHAHCRIRAARPRSAPTIMLIWRSSRVRC